MYDVGKMVEWHTSTTVVLLLRSAKLMSASAASTAPTRGNKLKFGEPTRSWDIVIMQNTVVCEQWAYGD